MKGSVESCIDYIISSTDLPSVAFNVLDLDMNLSDHLPILCVFSCRITDCGDAVVNSSKLKSQSDDVRYFRWDHAPLCQYYEQTRVLLEPILAKLDAFDHSVVDSEMSASHDKLEIIYNSVVMALTTSANLCVPKTRRNFYKFWWNQELSELKAAAVTSSSEYSTLWRYVYFESSVLNLLFSTS